MGKLLPMLLLIVAVNLGMVMFVGIDLPTNALWTLVSQPEQWSNLTLIDYLKDGFLILGAATIIIGVFMSEKSFFIFGGIASVFMSFGMSLVELYQHLLSSSYFESGYLALIIVSPIILAYVYTILLFWRGRD